MPPLLQPFSGRTMLRCSFGLNTAACLEINAAPRYAHICAISKRPPFRTQAQQPKGPGCMRRMLIFLRVHTLLIRTTGWKCTREVLRCFKRTRTLAADTRRTPFQTNNMQARSRWLSGHLTSKRSLLFRHKCPQMQRSVACLLQLKYWNARCCDQQLRQRDFLRSRPTQPGSRKRRRAAARGVVIPSGRLQRMEGGCAHAQSGPGSGGTLKLSDENVAIPHSP